MTVVCCRTPTVIPIGLNKLSLFGTKMVTLFGRWNKRLLLNKSLSGGGTTDTLWTLKHFNLSRLNCPPSFIYYFLLFSEMHIYKTRWRVWKRCLLPAVWSKPASWENSPTHHPTKFITSFMSETLPDDVVDCDTGLQRTFQILQFPFDLHRRNVMCQHSLLLATFMVHRYRWRESGIFIFLTKDQVSVSAVAWAAWDEYMERVSDDVLGGSPHLGVAAPQLPL